MCKQKMRALSYIGAEKITFPPKPDIHTDGRRDISVYRVASLLKRRRLKFYVSRTLDRQIESNFSRVDVHLSAYIFTRKLALYIK